MKKYTKPFCFLALLSAIILPFTSCDDNNDNPEPPTIELIEAEGFFFSDTLAPAAAQMNFRVSCKSNGTDVLTNIIVSSNGTRVVDEGINAQILERDITLIKTSDEEETIEFVIRDITGGSASTSVVLKLDENSTAGNVVRYNNVTLHAQNAENGESFLSFTDGCATLSLEEAFANQSNIHLLYYYDLIESDKNTISSPGANIDETVFPGEFGLAGWTTKNTTRFHKISLTQEEFEAIDNPAFLVDSYSEPDGKRKAKELVTGDTYAFKIESESRYGIFMVSEVFGQEAGSVTFSIVVQE
ncbi:MAG TPA: hypothetical protein PLE67_01370 [Tenuifilaceae bacterium]|nr:hypothetical protein [Tenuifilaceae bacterium]HPE17466.1 hypothetical protein [Tenuifilaceae bacterium]HPQ33456.1 hypothetical protein [Tenuifilaceae bacterium]